MSFLCPHSPLPPKRGLPGTRVTGDGFESLYAQSRGHFLTTAPSYFRLIGDPSVLEFEHEFYQPCFLSS